MYQCIEYVLYMYFNNKIMNKVKKTKQKKHLTHAVEMFNVCVAPADKISLDSLASSNINQKMLSSKLDDYQLQGIFNRSSVADRARLLSQLCHQKALGSIYQTNTM